MEYHFGYQHEPLSVKLSSGRSVANLETQYAQYDLWYEYFFKLSPIIPASENSADADEDKDKDNKDKEFCEKYRRAKSQLASWIDSKLAEGHLEAKRCDSCGKVLSWDFPYRSCESCYQKRQQRRFFYEDDFDPDDPFDELFF